MKIQVVTTYSPNWPKNHSDEARAQAFQDEVHDWKTGYTTVTDVLQANAGTVSFRLIDDSAADVEALQAEALAAAKAHKWPLVARLCRQIDQLVDENDALFAFYSKLEQAGATG